MSARADILAALVTTLKAATDAGGRVFRSRTLALKKDKLPAIILRPVSETVTEPTNAGSDRVLTFAVEVHTRGETPDVIAEPIGGSIVALILADPQVGGRAIDVAEIGSEWAFDDADGDAGVLTITFAVIFRTARTAT